MRQRQKRKEAERISKLAEKEAENMIDYFLAELHKKPWKERFTIAKAIMFGKKIEVKNELL